ncbi:serine hydrolase domain-containing protein [Paenibacillus methanolicus]|uniref:CubicO group peptidase (Beta-lactamase class C family) n=1 Tax=Paenibacillus methanolicus TaxID=582686 RepID=A0A5S5CE85_9BACL|nr:serine hydrolase domain-containing protein [Paenibacillus methanolicus]TYP76660.1 CubicO group peptidase (beta-lactamase class C family) [Paenibacillus methanolicus]
MSLSLETVIENHLSPRDFLVGGAVVVVKDGHAIYEKGFGHARLGSQEKRFTADTIACVMSIAKSFTAAALLTLVGEGRLHLDDPLVRYLPYFRTTDPEASGLITVKHLLSHTAGFGGDLGIGDLVAPNAAEFAFYDQLRQQVGLPDSSLSSIRSREDITRFIRKVALADRPGNSWHYCTDAYIVAADLFEKVSLQSWDAYIEDVLFKGLHLNRTTLDAEKVRQDDDHANYYTSEASDDRRILPSPFPVNPLAAPMGFLYSTAKDLARYLNAYMTDRSLLSPPLMEKMFEPVWRFDPHEGYALGWGTSAEKGYTVIEHGGGYQGVSAYLCMVPSEKLGVIVLANHDQTPSQNICYRVLRALLPE